MEVKRIAEMYNLVNLLDSSVITNEVKIIDQKLRAFPNFKYHFLSSIAVFSSKIEYLIIKNTFYKNSELANVPLNDFPFLPALERIKELSIIECRLATLNIKELNKYHFLRLLHLRSNCLKNFEDAEMGQLRDLDLMEN